MSLPAQPPAFPQFITDAANTIGGYANNVANFARKNPVTNFLFGNAMNTAQDIGTGLGVATTPGTQESADNSFKMAQAAEAKAKQTSDPAEKARLLKVASDAYATNASNAQAQMQNYSPDVSQNPIQRGLETGLQVGTGADIAAHPVQTVKAVGNIILHPVQTAKAIYKGADTLLNNPSAIKDAFTGELSNPNNFKMTTNVGMTKLGNRWLLGQYKNADAVARDPLGTVSMLKNYGLSSPEDISSAAMKVTGKAEGSAADQAIIHKKVLSAIKSADPVDVNGIIDKASNSMDEMTNVTDPQTERALNTVKRKILNATGLNIENNAMLYDELAKGAPVGLNDADPLKVFQASRDIDQLANTAYKAAYDRAGNLTNPAQKELGDFYTNTSAMLKDRLFNGTTSAPNVMRIGANNVRLSDTWTPEEIATLRSIGNGKLADDVTSATTVPELRKYEALFTNGGKMADQVLRAGEKSPSLTQMATGISTIVHPNPAGPAIFAASTRGGKEVIGNTLIKGGQIVGAPSATLKASLATEGAINKGLPSFGSSENQNAQNNQNQGIHTSDNTTPKYSVSTPLDDGTVISEQQQAQRQQALQTKMGQEQLGDPQAYNTDAGQYKANETEFNQQANLRGVSNETQTVVSTANNAVNAVNSADPNFVNALNQGWDSFSKANGGAYAGMAAQLKQLSQLSGVDLSTAKSKEALLEAIDAIVKNQQVKLDTAKTQYFGGGTQTVPTTQVPTQTTPQQPVNKPDINWQQNDPRVQAILGQGGGGSLPPFDKLF